jgi:Flp pilus assembly protein TadD
MRICASIVFLLGFTLPIDAHSPAAAIGASLQQGGGQDSEKAPPLDVTKAANQDSSVAAGDHDYSKEAFVIERLSARFRFENDGTGRKESIFRVRVQSEAGVQRWGQLRFGYNSADESMEIPYVRVLKPDGSVVKAGSEAVQDLAPVPQIASVYTDYREKHISVPGLRPGDVLECESVTVIHTALTPGQFWMQYDFDLSNIVLDEQLELDIPGGRVVKLKTKPGLDPKIKEDGGRRIYHWTSTHLVREDDSEKKDDLKKKKKKKTDELPAVQLTTYGSWEEVGRWYAGLEKDRRQPSKEIRDKAAALTKGMQTDLDRVEALYDYVATNFRYVSLSLGAARYQPHPAADVLHNQYGDCKDKHTLLAALLEAEGFHASAVLMNSFRKLDPEVPSPAQFNHVITMVPLGKEEVWMDTTTEVAPFRLLAYTLRKKQGLVISQDAASHLEETPADPPIPDAERTEISGKVGESGGLEGTVNYTLRGDSELAMRLILRRIPPADWKKFVENLNKNLGLGGEVSEVKIADPAATHEPFTLSYAVSKANFVDWSKKTVELKLPLSRFQPVAVSADVDEDAENINAESPEPFKLGPPNEQDYSIKLDLATRYTARVPVPVHVERDYGAYQSTYKLEGSVLFAERKLVMRMGELPPARANDYRAFRRSVLADAAQVVTVESTVADTHVAPAEMKTDELISSGNNARKNGDYPLAISLLNRAVEAAPKSRGAWNDLGLAYYESRQDELAVNAFQKQIEIDPFHQFSYNNLGRVYLRKRKYEEAIKWFNKQVEVNPLDKFAHANLGLAYIDWHKYEQAIPELEQAASLTPNNADPQTRLGEAYLNLGQDEKAMAAFDKAVQISATPTVWNNIAYQLVLKKAHFDIARNYAESAVSTTAASLRNLSLEQLTQRNLRSAAAMANYWDTLGWLEFTAGNVDKALKYVTAAWELGQDAVEADHLGQIYAKRDDKEKAQYFYALSLNARRPDTETRARFSELVGGNDKVDVLVEKYRGELLRLRTIKLGNVKTGSDRSAEFFVLLSPGHNSIATVDGVKFVSGDEKFKEAADVLRAAKYEQSFPDDTPVKVLRRGTLKCATSSGDCVFVLALPDDVSSVD